MFVGPNGELSRLIESHRLDKPYGITVYNFAVEDDHNYFVIANLAAFQDGSQPVLVHNTNYISGDVLLDPKTYKPVSGDIMTYKQWKSVGNKGDFRGHHPVSQSSRL